MDRRNFLYLSMGLAALSLYGCGSSSQSLTTPLGGPSVPAGPALSTTGRIDAEIEVDGPVVGSAFGPTTLTGREFSTSISATGVGLLALEDRAGGVRGFTLTFPNEVPVISFKSTALAIVMLEPGFLRLETRAARDLVTRIESSPAFESMVQYLRENSDKRLDFLSGEPAFAAARDALLESLHSPFEDPRTPDVLIEGQRVRITNPSPRFLVVERNGMRLPGYLPPYSELLDTPNASSGSYQFTGLGSRLGGSVDLQGLNEVFPATVFFATVLPLVEIAAGSEFSPEEGLAVLEYLDVAAPVLGESVFQVEPLSLAIGEYEEASINQLSDEVTASFNSLAELITAGSYLAGLGFSIGAIMKFKQHKDNPTQIPIGSPIGQVRFATLLLTLPHIADSPYSVSRRPNR